jgi:hypothetical protein
LLFFVTASNVAALGRLSIAEAVRGKHAQL